jgi:hypothetical protein
VTSNLDDGSVGTLRSQVAAANPGDTITFAPSLNGQTLALTQHGEIVLDRPLTIQGPGANLLTISGGGQTGCRIFEIPTPQRASP